MNKDTWIGIIGCVVLVAAMVGVFTYERANAAATDTNAADTAGAPVAGPTASGTVQLGDTETAIVTITQTSAANVTFRVTWTATNGKDTLKVTIAPPTGSGITEGAEDTQDSGEITLTMPVPPGANPAGGWEVKVEFTTATPAPLPGGIPPPTPPPGSTDGGVAFDVATTIG